MRNCHFAVTQFYLQSRYMLSTLGHICWRIILWYRYGTLLCRYAMNRKNVKIRWTYNVKVLDIKIWYVGDLLIFVNTGSRIPCISGTNAVKLLNETIRSDLRYACAISRLGKLYFFQEIVDILLYPEYTSINQFYKFLFTDHS